MPNEFKKPSIALIWRYSDITSSVVEMARDTGCRAVFDITSADLDDANRAFLLADAASDAVDVLMSADALIDGRLQEFLEETDISRVWIEIHPFLLRDDLDRALAEIERLSEEFEIAAVTGSVAVITRILRDYPGVRHIGLKGSEASGFVSGETAFTLFGSVRELTRDVSDAPALSIWGGVATPEAAAAFLAAGAQGIVFECVHWLTDLVNLSEEQARRVAGVRPDHTDLVGRGLEVPGRFFNKGNSKAVKELKTFAGSLCGAEITDAQRESFASRVVNQAVAPLNSTFGRDELIPLSVEAAFAGAFVRRFGRDTRTAVDRFMAAVDRCLAHAPKKLSAFVNSPVAEAMGTRFPFIQGAMSWITDVPEFARRVGDAGGLPTIALGLMDKETLNAKLGRIYEIVGATYFAVNVITLAENPHRDAQLAWIRQQRARFAVIAAGEPSHAKELMADGVDVMYISPNEDLMKMALEAGVRYVILEGHEAGGHVGQHSTLTLAQTVIDLKDREPALFEKARIVLAGGIFNRETAFMAAMLGADAVQMGTVYLATREIVETGALTSVYQRMILESPPGGTVVTGEGTGLRVRSLRTPTIDTVCELERDFAAGAEDEMSFRRKIETITAGSLLVAARGVERPGGSSLDENTIKQSGQFMSGAAAGALGTVRSLDELHRELAEGALAEGLPFVGPLRDATMREVEPVAAVPPEVVPEVPDKVPAAPAVVRRIQGPERIAITGMSIVNSLGNSPEEVWAASMGMRTGIIAVPASKWDHEMFFHPRPRMPEKTYCRFGAFQNIEVTRKEIGMPPQDFRTMTDSTKITMSLARKAVEESGILDSDIPRERIAVMISQNSGEAAATLGDVIIRGSAGMIADEVKKVVSLTPEKEQALIEAITADRIAIDDTTLLGRLNCSAGGFICNKYGFMGPSFSVSAACATALVALFSAYQMIRNGIIDAAVVGGAEEFLTPMHFLEFSALGALAGLSGTDRAAGAASRPFDADRDGMVLGEGGGVIVIERESFARKRGARAHAFITSMGASNNHLGMVESSRITQEIAIRNSFRDAYYGPDGVDLVECHATSTRQGDGEEVQALKTFHDPNRLTILTSFKSQIGHTLGASGINSLIRGVMAMKSGVFPPTLNYDTPDPEIGIEEAGFAVLGQPAEWPNHNGQPRRMQVNAFGFGGSNYVVHVEQARDGEGVVFVLPREHAHDPGEEAEGMAALPEGISLFKTRIGEAAHRMAVVAATPEEARSLIKKADLSGDAGLGAKRLRALGRQGIFLAPEDAAIPPLAFVFPGQGSHYAGMSHELYDTFPIVREWMDRAAAVAEFDLLRLLFHDREEDLQKTRWQQPALFTMEFAMVQYLLALGVKPTAIAGHSLGELTALCLAGVYSFEDGFRIVNKRAICMDKACRQNVDPGVMMAVDAPMEVIEEKLRENEGVYITNLNSPHQVVLGGNTETVKALGAEFKATGHRSTLLRVSMAFHSPIMRCIHDELEEFVSGIEFHSPKIPVVSNTTTKPFPDDVQEIKRILMAHLESPVHWMQNARTLWEDFGVRVFVEVGPRDILSNLVSDSIPEAECIQTCLPSAEAMMFRTAVAQLYARGNLPLKRGPRFMSLSGEETSDPSQDLTVAGPGTFAVQQTPMEATVNREIGASVLESFGRFLRPSILASIRREHDPSFGEEQLSSLLTRMFPNVTAAAPPVAPTARPVPVPTSQPGAPRPVAAVPAKVAQASASAQAPAAAPAEPELDETTEAVIHLIMDATGYERDEIEPDMDLREDLSIRSSRLPVIMDAVEAHFEIKIDLEDFMDVRTVRDVANRITELVARTEGKAPAVKPGVTGPREDDAGAQPQVTEPRPGIKRIGFREVPVEVEGLQPVELSPLDSVVVFSPVSGIGIRKAVGDVFRRDYGVTIAGISIFEKPSGAADPAFDLRTEKGVLAAVEKLGQVESPGGMVFVIDDLFDRQIASMDEVSAVLTGVFALMKRFLEFPSRKFVICVSKGDHTEGPGRILAEGILGMFLSAAHEFGSVQFRSVRLDEKTDLRDALRASLNRSQRVIETAFRDGSLFTVQGSVIPAVLRGSETMPLGPEDVVLFSGGAYGITPYIARSLAPFGCRMVFLGRTVLDQGVDLSGFVHGAASAEQAAAEIVSAQLPDLSEADRKRKTEAIAKAVEIARTLESLRAEGVNAEYFPCDVTDPAKTRAVVADVAAKYGKIDCVIHAAGFIKDNFVPRMSLEDFAAVANVKFLAAWNLFQAAEKAGLRFMACFSSGASIQGNPGQTNYAAGNRMMSALLSDLSAKHPAIRFKALILPPIEGAGMADDPEIRALMRRMHADYVHAQEFAELFCRELLAWEDPEKWVMFMRSLPGIETMKLDPTDPPADGLRVYADTVAVQRADFPMIDAVSRINVAAGDLEARRNWSQEKDLWIPDHQPFKFLKHPLVSAIMAVETFMEAAKLLYPQFRIHGIRDTQFLDIIDVPEGVERESEIRCHRVESDGPETLCEVSLATREISPSGRIMERMNFNYKSVVLMGVGDPVRYEEPPGFPVRPQELDSRPMPYAEAQEWYEKRSKMQGRYRVMHDIEGTARGAIRGRIKYRETDDFGHLKSARYQYPPYLLEALMQVVSFYIVMRDQSEQRSMIPHAVGEMIFFRTCANEEAITLEARMKEQNDEGITWNARALDGNGRTVMFVRDMVMRWFLK